MAVGAAFGTRKRWSWPFSLCLGALDGSHIPVKAEGLSRLSYLNWHGWFSINLMAMVDANMSFVYAFTGRPGRMGDSRVFKDSMFYQRMGSATHRLFPVGYFIIGQSLPCNFTCPPIACQLAAHRPAHRSCVACPSPTHDTAHTPPFRIGVIRLTYEDRQS